MKLLTLLNRRLPGAQRWVDLFCRLIAALIMGQTLIFKFGGAEESVYIFSALGAEPFGRIASGILELISAMFLIVSPFAVIGAILGLGLMTGAVLSHLLFLGIEVLGDGGLLFGLAVVVLSSCAVVLVLRSRGFILRESSNLAGRGVGDEPMPGISARTCTIIPKLPSYPRVVVVGGGFGGLQVVRALKNAPVEVLLFDRRNYYLFQPLLYQIATAALNPSQIAVPLRLAAERQANTTIYLAEVHSVDLARSVVAVGNQRTEYTYDYLVVAAGVQTNYFGNDQLKASAPGLKTIEEALAVRNKFLLAFEEAELCANPEERTALLTFVIVGGGPTGVELAGAMAEIARHTLECSFRRFSATSARVVLIEGGDRVLKTFPAPCSHRALRDLEDLGVEVLLNARVTHIAGEVISIACKDGSTHELRSRNVTWAAGVVAGPLSKTLGVAVDSVGRVIVQSDLSVAGHPNVFVIGDLAHFDDPRLGRPVPGVAQGAIQMGAFVGGLIRREVSEASGKARPTFAFTDKGSMATIGRGRAVVNIGRLNFGGVPAWMLWAVVHVAFLNGVRNRLNIVVQWIWMFLFYELGVRLITKENAHEEIPSVSPDPRILSKRRSDSSHAA